MNADELEQEIDRILFFMGTSEARKGYLDIPSRNFQEATPFTNEFMESVIDEDDKSKTLFRMGGDPLTIPGFDISYFSSLIGEEGSGNFAADRVRKLTPKEARGRTTVYKKLVCEVDMLFSSKEGKSAGDRMHIGYDGSKWTDITIDPGNRPRRTEAAERFGVAALMGHNVREDHWRVVLGYTNGPSAAIITDPIGAREVFRLRDLPEGKQRRSALRNWVKEHWRQQKRDPEEATKVRRHLRGAQNFTWNGLICRVKPSLKDIELNRQEGIK